MFKASIPFSSMGPLTCTLIQLFQRVWSGRITDERKAWELLSLIDQIHLWGVTTHREYVLRHLKLWHKYCKQVWAKEVRRRLLQGKDHTNLDAIFPFSNTPLWLKGFPHEFSSMVWCKAETIMEKARLEEQPGEPVVRCLVDRCGHGDPPGYNLFSASEHLRHLAKIHNKELTSNIRLVVKQTHRLAAMETEKVYGCPPANVRKRKFEIDIALGWRERLLKRATTGV